jgi:hypothetical protein
MVWPPTRRFQRATVLLIGRGRRSMAAWRRRSDNRRNGHLNAVEAFGGYRAPEDAA